MGRPVKQYSEEEKIEALLLILSLGNVAEVSRRIKVGRETLIRWRDEDPVRFDRLKEDYKAHLDKFASGQLRAQVHELLDVNTKLLQRMRDEYMKVPADQIPTAIRQNFISMGVAIDKVRLAEDKPTSIVQQRSAAEIVKELKDLNFDFDSTAEDLPSAPSLASGESVESNDAN